MNHTKLADFPDLAHRMTVQELKEHFCEWLSNNKKEEAKCEWWQIGGFNFYSKKGKMKSCDDDTKRLFEIGVTDGVKMQFVKDDNAVKPTVAPVPKPVDTRPVNVRLHEIIVDKIHWF